MCGINGILRLDPDRAPVDTEELIRCRDSMASRGPDGDGQWRTETIGLGHRRLSIIDLSEAGSQPMSWAEGRYRIVYNGEIFNYRELRDALVRQGVKFRSTSDTEVILALYDREGTDALRRLRGMFALALWDDKDEKLLLARDPYGIKPLYFSESDGYLRFASQVKALLAGGSIDTSPSPGGLVGFLLWGSVPEPFTIYDSIRALPSGHFLVAGKGSVSESRPFHNFGEFSTPDQPDCGAALEDSVRAHLVSDVPVGIFLSAGLDSSLVAALACRHLAEPPVTLTLRFESFVGTPFDEAPLAAEIARTLGTRHVERTVRRADFMDLWPRALSAMDQPSIDGFNTFIVSDVAHAEGFKVALSGLGGDELLGGYSTFGAVGQWRKYASVLARVPGLGAAWPTLARTLLPGKPKLAGFLRHGSALAGAYYLHRGLFLPQELPAILGARMTREGLASYDPVRDAAKLLPTLNGDGGMRGREWVGIHLMESTQYMRNQLLRDSDWASMAHSLEVRVPMADAWLREQIARRAFEPARSHGKAAMVRQAAPELPDALWNRPKSGFFIPVMEFIDGEAGRSATGGLASRKLALRVLKAFGIDTGCGPVAH